MTKEERAEHIKRNPRSMYFGFSGVFALMALFFLGLAQVQNQPAYLPYDKSTRPYIWMCIMLAGAGISVWKACTSPKGKPKPGS